MNRSLGNVIADSLSLGLGYADRLLVGIEPDKFARFAKNGETIIESNHPSFILGHLALYPGRIVDHLGAGKIVIPEGFESVYSKDAKCVDDPDGSIYPPMPEVVEAFQSGYGAAMTALRDAADSDLDQPNPSGGRMTELFPSVGSMFAFYVGGHVMLHIGQMSAWRRAMGMGAA
ncbi:MAG: DinB family protein [Rubripirellula sp.]